jgi:hypothetical protein
MAFEQVQIRSVRNGLNPVIGWRQDLDQGDAIYMALTDYTGVSSLQWWMVGRPEGSGNCHDRYLHL